MSLLGSIKDNITSIAAEKFMASYVERYGKLLSFKIDSSNKSINLKVELKGETEPVEVKITGYSFVKEGSKDYIIVNNIKTSREWLNVAAEDYLSDKKILIPSQYSGIIKKLL